MTRIKERGILILADGKALAWFGTAGGTVRMGIARRAAGLFLSAGDLEGVEIQMGECQASFTYGDDWQKEEPETGNDDPTFEGTN